MSDYEREAWAKDIIARCSKDNVFTKAAKDLLSLVEENKKLKLLTGEPKGIVKVTAKQAMALYNLALRHKDVSIATGLKVVDETELKEGSYISVYAAGMMIGVELDGYAHT